MSNLSQAKILHFERIFLFLANKIPKILQIRHTCIRALYQIVLINANAIQKIS